MITLSLPEIEGIVNEKAAVINAPQKFLPQYGHQGLGAHHYVTIEHGICYYTISETGHDAEKFPVIELNELLYLIFRNITFSMAVEWEAHNGNDQTDSHEQLFGKQIELMTAIDRAFGEQVKKEIDAVFLDAASR